MTKLLEKYQKMRDFKKTKEPSGKTDKKPKGDKHIFVVQEHHASHLHYDFRLELDGVLKSWAVPKGPSEDPSVKRLAMEVEDHPLSYASFKGTIPKGEYGAGKVYIWDKGTWEVEGDAHEGLKKGKLEFSLKGKKLHGKWLLVKTKWGSNKNSWLLMKRPDEDESEEAEVPEVKEKKTRKKSVA